MSLSRKSYFVSHCATAIISVMLMCGCSWAQTSSDRASLTAANAASSTALDQREILAAQRDHARRVEVTVTAIVYKKLADDTRGLPHERFLLKLDNGSTVLVAHDTKMAPYIPLQAGDLVCLRGEYIWNEKGGVLHWTHHSTNGGHEGGWIDFAGKRYQ